MNYDHITLFPENPWLTLGIGLVALVLFQLASRYIYSKRKVTTRNQSE